MRVRLKDIKLAELNSSCIIIVTKFVRAARVREGVDIRLNDEHIVYRVVNLGRSTQDPKMRMLFVWLRRELKLHFSGLIEEASELDAQMH